MFVQIVQLKTFNFFINEDDQALTINGERYRVILNDFLWLELIEMNLMTFTSILYKSSDDYP